jgi:hypothetical protein
VFRRILYLVTFCIASLVLLVSTSARASIPQAHQGAKTALSAPSFAAKRIKAKKSQSAECTYRIATATAGMHKGKVALILASCGGTPSVWGWPGQNPVRYADPSGRNPVVIALGAAAVGAYEAVTGAVELYAIYKFFEDADSRLPPVPFTTLNSSIQALAPNDDLLEDLIPDAYEMSKGGRQNKLDTGVQKEMIDAGSFKNDDDKCRYLEQALEICNTDPAGKALLLTAKKSARVSQQTETSLEVIWKHQS